MFGICNLAILQSKRQVDAHLALSTSLQGVVIWSDHGVSDVNVANSLVGVEEVELTKL
jgi:hypothetical protein